MYYDEYLKAKSPRRTRSSLYPLYMVTMFVLTSYTMAVFVLVSCPLCMASWDSL